jgi:hypothetical protein
MSRLTEDEARVIGALMLDQGKTPREVATLAAAGELTGEPHTLSTGTAHTLAREETRRRYLEAHPDARPDLELMALRAWRLIEDSYDQLAQQPNPDPREVEAHLSAAFSCQALFDPQEDDWDPDDDEDEQDAPPGTLAAALADLLNRTNGTIVS